MAMSVSSANGKLKRASKQLLARWSSTKLSWRDENCAKFEEKYIDLLSAKLRTAQETLGHMDTVLARVRQDCQ